MGPRLWAIRRGRIIAVTSVVLAVLDSMRLILYISTTQGERNPFRPFLVLYLLIAQLGMEDQAGFAVLPVRSTRSCTEVSRPSFGSRSLAGPLIRRLEVLTHATCPFLFLLLLRLLVSQCTR